MNIFKKQTILLWVAMGIFTFSFAQNHISKPGAYKGYNTNNYSGYEMDNVYITMRDSVKIAASVFLPKELEADKKIPTIIYLTRYTRLFQTSSLISWMLPDYFGTVKKEEVKYFTKKGYAVMIVDARGSGASTGVRKGEFTMDEILDGAEVVDWIIEQPWSNGNVGSNGISYVGTAAELLLVNNHPSVKAVINRSGVFDLYHDTTFPGGTRLGGFIDVWGESVDAMDQAEYDVFGLKAKWLLKGPKPVESDKDLSIYRQAREDHKQNFTIIDPLKEMTYRNEIVPELGQAIDQYSVHNFINEIERCGTPIFRISGWLDGANVRGQIHGFWATENTDKLLIGPWDHGAKEFISPFADELEEEFSIFEEMLRFFDYHLYGIDNGIMEEPPVLYYNMGQEEWRHVENWPDPNFSTATQTYYMSADATLQATPATVLAGTLTHQIDPKQTTGGGSRWNSLAVPYRYAPIGYPEWTSMSSSLLTFTSDELQEDMDITGHPVISLQMASSTSDAHIMVYLQDLGPDSTVTYITEGVFNPLHRYESQDTPPYPNAGPYHSFKAEDGLPICPGEAFEVRFDLIPTSYTLQAGHKLQIAIAGADQGHFDLPLSNPSELDVVIDYDIKCSIELPVKNKADLASK